MKAITTFSDKGYEQYGRRCLETFVEHWPCDIIVFYENDEPDFKHEKIKYFPINLLTNRNDFLDAARTVEHADGMVNGKYRYQFDAIKFCHKAFCQMAVRDDVTFWVDADCITHSDISEDYLRGLVSDVAVSCFDRKGSYPETGFIGFNHAHKDFQTFRKQYEDVYLSGEIFELTGWHDCYALQHALRGIEFRNLSPEGEGVAHVIAKSDLSKFIDHTKGPRKQLGHSPESAVQWWKRPTVPCDGE